MTARWGQWRIAVRMARRELHRSRGRSVLIAVLIGLPVFGAAAVEVVYRSTSMDTEARLALEVGDGGQALISRFEPGVPQRQDVSGQSVTYSTQELEPRRLSLAEATRALQQLTPAGDRVLPITGYETGGVMRGTRHLTYYASVLALPLQDPAIHGLLRHLRGRLPTAPGEVLLGTDLGSATPALGDQVMLRAGVGPRALPMERTVTVVGSAAFGTGGEAFIAAAGELVPAAHESSTPATGPPSEVPAAKWLVAGPVPVPWSVVAAYNQAGAVVFSRAAQTDPSQPPVERGPNPAAETALQAALIGAGLVLLQIALMAGPAISVTARRQERQLALLMSVGAPPRQVRAVVLAFAGLAGAAGSVVGVLLGWLVGSGLVLWASERGGLPDALLRWRIDELALVMLLGTVTAVAAAVVPALTVSRTPPLAGLTGRRAVTTTSTRLTVVGVVLALAGAGIAWVGTTQLQSIGVVGGIALGELGLVALVGGIVAVAAKVAGRLGLVTRIALRDAARNRGRTAPAVAATMAAIAGSVTVMTFMAAQQDVNAQMYTPRAALGALLVEAPEISATPGSTTSGDQAEGVNWAAMSVRLADLPVSTPVAVREAVAVEPNSGDWVQAIRPAANRCPDPPGQVFTPEYQAHIAQDPRCRQATGGRQVGIGSLVDDGRVFPVITGVPDPAAVQALQAGKVLVGTRLPLWPDGTVHLSSGDRTIAVPGFVLTSGVRFEGADSVVLPPGVAQRLGLVERQRGLLAVPQTELSQEQLDAVARSVTELSDGRARLYLERGSSKSVLELALIAALGAVVALVGTITAVALTAAEGRADLATLAAVGGAPSLRRRLRAAQALVIAGIGSALGLLGGLISGYLLIRLRQQGVSLSDTYGMTWRFQVPMTTVPALVLGVPAVAVLIAFLTTRSRQVMVRRAT